jgi:diacylglycerol kinase (ATP)
MEDRKNLSFGRRLRFALAGLGFALRTERSFRTQAVFLVLVIIGLAILRPAPLWWGVVILASAAVLAAELFNTAIEQLADHLHPKMHPAIRIVKDCAAAGVLLAVVGAIGVGIALIIKVIQG